MRKSKFMRFIALGLYCTSIAIVVSGNKNNSFNCKINNTEKAMYAPIYITPPPEGASYGSAENLFIKDIKFDENDGNNYNFIYDGISLSRLQDFYSAFGFESDCIEITSTHTIKCNFNNKNVASDRYYSYYICSPVYNESYNEYYSDSYYHNDYTSGVVKNGNSMYRIPGNNKLESQPCEWIYAVEYNGKTYFVDESQDGQDTTITFDKSICNQTISLYLPYDRFECEEGDIMDEYNDYSYIKYNIHISEKKVESKEYYVLYKENVHVYGLNTGNFLNCNLYIDASQGHANTKNLDGFVITNSYGEALKITAKDLCTYRDRMAYFDVTFPLINDVSELNSRFKYMGNAIFSKSGDEKHNLYEAKGSFYISNENDYKETCWYASISSDENSYMLYRYVENSYEYTILEGLYDHYNYSFVESFIYSSVTLGPIMRLKGNYTLDDFNWKRTSLDTPSFNGTLVDDYQPKNYLYSTIDTNIYNVELKIGGISYTAYTNMYIEYDMLDKVEFKVTRKDGKEMKERVWVYTPFYRTREAKDTKEHFWSTNYGYKNPDELRGDVYLFIK